MTRPARVLWLAKGLGRGGAEQLLVTSAAHVDPDRFTVEVAYLLPHKDALVATLRGHGLTVHCLGQRSAVDVAWVARLRRLVTSRGYDLVHSHMPVPAVAARLVLPRTALVHSEHNVWQRYRRPTYWANALTYRRNDAVIAVSKAVAASVSPRWSGHAEVEVLLHGVEFDAMRRGAQARAEGRRRLGVPDDVPLIGTVGNCTAKKDQTSLLCALVQVRRAVPDARLVIIGTGPLQDQLRDRADKLGLGEAVVLTGMRGDVPHLLPAFDVFTLSSLHEGLSIALVEALASGVPAVCTWVGGIPEVLTDDVEGRLVPPGDPAALAAALVAVLQDGALQARYGRSGLQRAHQLDIRRATLRIEDIYDEVLTSR